MSENARFGEIRSLLHREGTAASWGELCALIDLCDQRELEEQILPYAQAHIGRWPEHTRIAPRRWSDRLEKGLPVERLALASKLELFASRSTLRSNQTEDNQPTHPQLEGLLANRPPKLRLLELSINGRLGTKHVSALAGETELLEQLRVLRIEKSQLGDQTVEWLAHHESLEQLEALHLPHNRIGRSGIELLCESQSLPSMHTLRLDHNNPGPLGAEALLRAPWREQLQHFGIGGAPLDARGGELGWESISMLAEAGFFNQMRSLILSGNQLGHAVGGPGVLFPAAEELDLSFNHLFDDGLERILAGSQSDALKRLHLSINRLTAASINVLTSAEAPQLEALDLFGNQITGEGIARLVSSPVMRRLEKLNLGSTQLDPGFATSIQDWQTTRLEEVSFQGTSFDDNDAYVLSRAEELGRLRVIDLSSTQIRARGVRAIATSPFLGSLERLILNYSRVGDEGITSLSERAHPALRRLDLRACGISVHGARALARAPWLGQLTGLDLSNNPLSEEGRRALYESEHLPLHLRARFKPIDL